jgi:hypothetical protein
MKRGIGCDIIRTVARPDHRNGRHSVLPGQKEETASGPRRRQ